MLSNFQANFFNFKDNTTSAKYSLILSLIFALFVFLDSWTCDDAYHAYVMAYNLVEGNGLVYNVGYRVNASTCPFFTLLVALILPVFSDPCFAGIFLGVLFSGLAVYLVFKNFCKNGLELIFIFFMLTCCRSFFDFTTSGLENSALYFFTTCISVVFLKNENYTRRSLLTVSLCTAFLMGMRMDNFLIVIPMLTYIFFRCPEKLLYKLLILIIGMFPLITWELFSILYYGFPFPNTAYAKLYTGIPLEQYLERGLSYLRDSFLSDLPLLTGFLLCIVQVFRAKNLKGYVLLIGVTLYLIYVIYIGGDFMAGRHLTVIYLLSLIGFLCLVRLDTIKLFYAVFSLIALFFAYTTVAPSINRAIYTQNYGCHQGSSTTDEKQFYQIRNIFEYIFRHSDIEQFVVANCKSLHFKDRKGFDRVVFDEFIPGKCAYYLKKAVSPKLHIVDLFALSDEFRSRLPAVKQKRWRTGHMWRQIPCGYLKTIESGSNLLYDENLKKYYEYLYQVVANDVFDINRLKIIINMNIGKYDYLVKNTNFCVEQNDYKGQFTKCD